MKQISKKQKKLLKARKDKGKKGKTSRVSQQEIDLLYVTAARFFEAGKKKEAEGYLKKVVKFDPGHHESLSVMGLIAAENGMYNDAVRLLKKAITFNPSQANYYNALGNCYKALEDYYEAVVIYQKGIDLQPECPEQFYINKALALIELGKVREAIADFQKAIELKPDFAEAYKGLGSAFKLTGDFEQAQIALRRVIDINPDSAFAYAELSECSMYTSSKDDQIRMNLAFLEKENIPEKDKIPICFSLGKMYDDCQEYDLAFKYYQQGNNLKRKEFHFDIKTLQEETDGLISFFSKSFFENNTKYGSFSDKLVFIIGMPRSGTSLVEQIFSSHSHVFGAGELPAIQRIVDELKLNGQFPECIGSFSEQDVQNLAQKYEQYIDKLTDENFLRVTDKMPFNYENLGLIALLFPRARVVHCCRTPLDTCLSNYFQNYKYGNMYSYDLKELGCCYKHYIRLMKYWKQVLPLDVIEVCYEEVIEDPETQSKRLIDFLGLEWEESCINFHKSKREVKTASAWQVRQPIYKSSSQRWKNYEKFLGPLKESLNIVG